MSKIRIKNIGPIKDGFDSDDGYMEIKKVTVFIGEQGSGKSTVAKLFSSFTWLEKVINRGDIKFSLRGIDILNAIEWQQRGSYHSPESEIEYIGDAVNISFGKHNEDKPSKFVPIVERKQVGKYVVPKVMYVPAERNFLSTIKSANDVTGLPGPLVAFAEELKLAQLELKGENLDLPIREYIYKYDEFKDTSLLLGKGYSINLLEASSGLQSLIPLYIVSRNLASFIAISDNKNEAHISVNQRIRRNNEIASISLDKTISELERSNRIEEVLARYHNKCFINIVEEPEQNLFPTSQRGILNSLLEFNNMTIGNKLIMTTHSPYLINYLSIAIQGGHLLNKLKEANREDLINRLNTIVPIKSCISADDVVIYQLREDGSITRLPDYEGIPSDKNYLNQSLAKGNQLFDSLLEIEEEL